MQLFYFCSSYLQFIIVHTDKNMFHNNFLWLSFPNLLYILYCAGGSRFDKQKKSTEFKNIFCILVFNLIGWRQEWHPVTKNSLQHFPWIDNCLMVTKRHRLAGCLPYAVEKQLSILLINLGSKWTLKWWWRWSNLFSVRYRIYLSVYNVYLVVIIIIFNSSL